MPGTYDNVTIVLGPGFDGDGDGDYSALDYPGTLPPGVVRTRDWAPCDAAVSPTPPPSIPSIAGIEPSAGPEGTPVTITGAGFTGASAVSFDGVAASFRLDSDAQITASVPAGATSGPISVTTPGGTAISGSDYTVTARPSIVAIDPTSGPAGPAG